MFTIVKPNTERANIPKISEETNVERTKTKMILKNMIF